VAEKLFQSAEERISYAWALHFAGKDAEAERQFLAMDRPSSNHKHRLGYCTFLQATAKKDQLRETLSDIIDEFELMKGSERKFNSDSFRDAKELHFKLNGS